MTPDELREPRAGVHEDGTEELKSWDALYAQCLAAADAWEATLRDLRDSSAQIVLDNETVSALRTRLEAAEKDLKFWQAIAKAETLTWEQVAALAGEEKP